MNTLKPEVKQSIVQHRARQTIGSSVWISDILQSKE
jgi:hypothetical protein